MKLTIPLLHQCEAILYCTEEEQAYTKAVVSSVISALITSVNFTDASSPVYQPLQDLISHIISMNAFYLTTSLLYSLLFFTDPSSLPSVVMNLNYLIKYSFTPLLIDRMVLQANNRVVVMFSVTILLFVYIHDHNRQITYEVNNISTSQTGLTLASMIDLPLIFNLCERHADTVDIKNVIKDR